jgi:integrase
MAKPLTKLAIDNLKPDSARREIPDGDTRGLFLVVQTTGKKSWAFRYRHAGAPKKLTLGPCPEIPLADARVMASEARVKVARGIDPAAEKKSNREAELEERKGDRDSLATVVDRFVELYAKRKNRESTWRETERLLKKHVVEFKPWQRKRLPQITRKDVHELLDSIMSEDKPILANRLFGVFRKLCNWAGERDIIKSSPCDGISPPAEERSRDRILDDDELRAVWRASDQEGVFGPLVKLLILTGQRRDEVAAMRWSEVDLAAKAWILPRERSKNHFEHVVPLSEAALAVLASASRVHSKKGFVFTTNGETYVSGFSRAKERLEAQILEARKRAAKEAGEDPDEVKAPPRWTLHDLRRTAASGMARLGQPVHVVEAVLNHRSGAIRGVARVYNRYDYAEEKREALERWGAHVSRIAS